VWGIVFYIAFDTFGVRWYLYIIPHHPEGIDPPILYGTHLFVPNSIGSPSMPVRNAFIRSIPYTCRRYVKLCRNRYTHQPHPEGMRPKIYAFGCIPSGCGWCVGHRFLHSVRHLRCEVVFIYTST